MSRPLIGISAYLELTSWGVWRDVRATFVPFPYVDQVQRAGGHAVVVPPLPTVEDATGLVARLDGILLSGGSDVDPARYGERAHPAVQPPRPERDRSELALAAAAASRDLPTLGVCRGMQVMAVAAGGRLIQHLPDAVGSDLHAPATGVRGEHDIRMVPGSRLHALLGDTVTVSTYHHQAVAEHPGYFAAGHAIDGTVEAFEAPEATFRIGIQWHPEIGTDPRLFTALVAAAASRPAH